MGRNRRVWIVLATLALVFLAETAVMPFLPLLRLAPGSIVEALVDATVLAALILPLLLVLEARRARTELEAAQLAAIVEHSEDAVIRTSSDLVITNWNAGAERLTGYGAEEAIGQPPTFFIAPERHGDLPALIERLGRGERVTQFETMVLRKDGTRFDTSVSLAPIFDSTGHLSGIAVVARDVTERNRAAATQALLIRELQQALAQVKTLGGLLPICAHCKKIRDDTGYWHQVEVYVRDHTTAEFSHSICPECTQQLYGEYLDGPTPG